MEFKLFYDYINTQMNNINFNFGISFDSRIQREINNNIIIKPILTKKSDLIHFATLPKRMKHDLISTTRPNSLFKFGTDDLIENEILLNDPFGAFTPKTNSMFIIDVKKLHNSSERRNSQHVKISKHNEIQTTKNKEDITSKNDEIINIIPTNDNQRTISNENETPTPFDIGKTKIDDFGNEERLSTEEGDKKLSKAKAILQRPQKSFSNDKPPAFKIMESLKNKGN